MQITVMRLTVGLLFFVFVVWFGILESYAIKQFMCVIGMKLAEVVCSCARPLAKFDWV